MKAIQELINLIESIIKEPEHKKTVWLLLIGIAISSVFVYVSIYLFSNTFFINAPIAVPAAIAVGLGLIYYTLIAVSVESTDLFTSRMTDDKSMSIIYRFVIAGLFAAFSLAGWISVFYILNQLGCIRGWVTFPIFSFIVYGYHLASTVISAWLELKKLL